MTKNVLVLTSSPRKKGNSTLLASQSAEALKQAGFNVETIFLHGMNIAPCNHCEGCIRQKVCCVQKDEMQTLYPKIIAADGIILASPIYWCFYNAQLKVFIDRWYGMWQNQPDFIKGKPVGVILTYGNTDLNNSGGIHAVSSLTTTLDFLGAKLAGFVYGTTNNVGDAEKDPGLMTSAWDLGEKIGDMLKE